MQQQRNQNLDSQQAQASGGECIPFVDCVNLAGVNHRTAPLSLREKVSLPMGAADELARLKEEMGIDEIVALGTCNRTEIYWVSGKDIDPLALFSRLTDIGPEDLAALKESMYRLQGCDAASHLFRVTCGLDSMVTGETQILNQVKRAYERSRARGLTDTSLNLLFQKAFEVTKKVHTQTRLTAQRASIPSVALKLTEAVFDDLSKTLVMVVGTGEIAQVTLDSLRKRGARNLIFVTRTQERAEIWREKHPAAEVYTIQELPELLHRPDIVVSCTRADRPVITAEMIKQAFRRRKGSRRPLLLLDLGIPRNIDPEADRISQVYLYNIDDLQEVVDKNRARLEEEMLKASRIIEHSLEGYLNYCRGATAGSTIAQIRAFAEQVAQRELERTLRKLPELTPKEQEEMKILVHRVLGKLLHHPSEGLKTASRNGRADEAIYWARRLFGLDKNEDQD